MNVTLQSAKFIGAGIGTVGLIGVGIGIGIVFGSLLLSWAIKNSNTLFLWILISLVSRMLVLDSGTRAYLLYFVCMVALVL